MHNIWVGTSYGVSCLLFKDDQLRYVNSYSQWDNVPNESFVNGKALRLPDGTITMQMLDHVIEFNPDKMGTIAEGVSYDIHPKLIRVMVNGNNLHTGEELDGKVILDKAIPRTSEINLNYNQNSITLTFSALNYFRPQQTYYRVRINGLDNTWRVLTNYNSGGLVDSRGMLHLPMVALKPGSYTVEVQCSMIPDVWESEPYEWVVNVNEPWWRTKGVTWIYMLLFIVLLGVNTYYYMRTTPDASQAALFWLEDIGKGQYAIAVRDPHNSAESDTNLGYLRILDDGTGTGSGNIGYFRAALILDMKTSESKAPTAATNSAWSLLQATFVHAKTATASQPDDITLAKKLWGEEKGKNGFRYVTAYYPFNVAPTNDDAKVFKGITYANDNHVYFKDVDATIPAFNGAVLMVPNTDNHNYIELAISSCTTGSGFDGNVLKGITLSENGPVFGAWYKQGEDANITRMRDGYYIFTTDEGSKASLSLMHPSDPWLMANRAFIPNTSASQAKVLPSMFLLDDVSTSVSPIHYRSVLDGYWYNLSGERVVQPTKGLFIHNGKKILVK